LVIHHSRSYNKDLESLKKDSKFSFKTLEKQIDFFKENIQHPSLEYKKITCKKSNNRYSIRVDVYFRILLDKLDDETYHFMRLVSHKEYDRLTKAQNC
jgi:hypothetical protein